MNSCRSTELSACAPPFRMFIIGTGSRRLHAAEIAVQRRLLRCRRGARGGHRDRENRVRAQRPLFGVPSSSIILRSIAPARCIHALQVGTDLGVIFSAALRVPLPRYRLLVAIAQFHRFVLACRGAGRHRGAAHAAVREVNIRFHRRVATRIENLSADYLDDFHWLSLEWFCVKSQFRTR